MKTNGSGWHNERRRHSLAARGVKTARASNSMPSVAYLTGERNEIQNRERILFLGRLYKKRLKERGDALEKGDKEKLARAEREMEITLEQIHDHLYQDNGFEVEPEVRLFYLNELGSTVYEGVRAHEIIRHGDFSEMPAKKRFAGYIDKKTGKKLTFVEDIRESLYPEWRAMLVFRDEDGNTVTRDGWGDVRRARMSDSTKEKPWRTYRENRKRKTISSNKPAPTVWYAGKELKFYKDFYDPHDNRRALDRAQNELDYSRKVGAASTCIHDGDHHYVYIEY